MESDVKPPSEEFMRWCRQSLRGLNRGVNGKQVYYETRRIYMTNI